MNTLKSSILIWLSIQDTFSSQIKDAYFIHSAGYVNLSTDEEQREKIFDENTKITKSLFNLFHPFIKKFIYIGTAFSSGKRKGLIDNDFHSLDFKPEHRNAYENAKFHSENFIAQECKKIGLPFQILRPSVIGGKMLGNRKPLFYFKIYGFLSFGKILSLYFPKKKRTRKCAFYRQ